MSGPNASSDASAAVRILTAADVNEKSGLK